MPIDVKIKYVYKAQLCPDCFDASFQKKKGQPHVDCPIRSRKAFYTCKGDGCTRHFWLCKTHEFLNRQSFRKSQSYWQEKGKVFVNFTRMLKASPKKITPQKPNPSAGKYFDSKKSGQKLIKLAPQPAILSIHRVTLRRGTMERSLQKLLVPVVVQTRVVVSRMLLRSSKKLQVVPK